MPSMTSLLQQLAHRGHKVTITAQMTEDDSGEMSIRFMCNDSPNRFGLALRITSMEEHADQLFVRALETLVHRAKELVK